MGLEKDEYKRGVLFFNRNFDKLPEYWLESEALLVGMQFVDDFESFKESVDGKEFLAYDSLCSQSEEQFVFTYDKALILTFFHLDSKKIFTTIRSTKSDNLLYYHQLLFCRFVLRRAPAQ